MPDLRPRQEQTGQPELAASSAFALRFGPVTELQTLLTSLTERYGTKTALAAHIGLALERLVKVMKDPKESLGVANCLRLATVSGLPPTQILRMAGKPDIADLLELHYGRTPKRGADREALMTQWWPTLSPKAKEAMRTLLDELTVPKKRTPRKKGR